MMGAGCDSLLSVLLSPLRQLEEPSEVEDVAFWSAGTATVLQAGEPAATQDGAQTFSPSHVTPDVHFRTVLKEWIPGGIVKLTE